MGPSRSGYDLVNVHIWRPFSASVVFDLTGNRMRAIVQRPKGNERPCGSPARWSRRSTHPVRRIRALGVAAVCASRRCRAARASPGCGAATRIPAANPRHPRPPRTCATPHHREPAPPDTTANLRPPTPPRTCATPHHREPPPPDAAANLRHPTPPRTSATRRRRGSWHRGPRGDPAAPSRGRHPSAPATHGAAGTSPEAGRATPPDLSACQARPAVGTARAVPLTRRDRGIGKSALSDFFRLRSGMRPGERGRPDTVQSVHCV
jgi:hypothetical protein